jgi:hypothetical protein
MPVPAPPDGCTRISLFHTSVGKAWGTHFWVQQDTPTAPTVAELATLAGDIEADYIDQIVPAYTNDTLYVETQAAWHDGAGGQIVGSAATITGGTDTGDSLPLSICFVISERIGAAYRGGKPRMYLSGLAEGLLQSTPNLWDTTIVSAFQTGWDHVFGVVNGLSLAGSPVTWGELSYFKDAAERAGTPPPVARTVPLFRVVTALSAKPQIGHQRLRDRF